MSLLGLSFSGPSGRENIRILEKNLNVAAHGAAGTQPRVERDGACAVPGETLGIQASHTRPEGPQENSIPDVPFVELNLVTFQERSELILKGQTFVMLLLRSSIFSHLFHS